MGSGNERKEMTVCGSWLAEALKQVETAISQNRHGKLSAFVVVVDSEQARSRFPVKCTSRPLARITPWP
jgi:hypothetical protein